MPLRSRSTRQAAQAADLQPETHTCVVPGCEKPRRRPRADLCAMHYHRQYRHGRLDATAHATTVSASAGRRYRNLYRPSHPLAGAGGRVYEHRAVLFDAIGDGQHPCAFCGRMVDWRARGHDALEVDHANGLGDDNRLANLRPSCRRCNTTRAQQARAAALREAGWWSEHDTIAASKTQMRATIVAAACGT